MYSCTLHTLTRCHAHIAVARSHSNDRIMMMKLAAEIQFEVMYTRPTSTSLLLVSFLLLLRWNNFTWPRPNRVGGGGGDDGRCAHAGSKQSLWSVISWTVSSSENFVDCVILFQRSRTCDRNALDYLRLGTRESEREREKLTEKQRKWENIIII